jgi:hypothetical protein
MEQSVLTVKIEVYVVCISVVDNWLAAVEEV